MRIVAILKDAKCTRGKRTGRTRWWFLPGFDDEEWLRGQSLIIGAANH
jgi:hypothetical protein